MKKRVDKTIKVEIELPEEIYQKLEIISHHKKVSINKLIIEDLGNLIKHYETQYQSIGLVL